MKEEVMQVANTYFDDDYLVLHHPQRSTYIGCLRSDGERNENDCPNIEKEMR